MLKGLTVDIVLNLAETSLEMMNLTIILFERTDSADSRGCNAPSRNMAGNYN